MEEKIIIIKGDTSDADKKVKGLDKNLDGLGKTAEKATDKASKGAENIGKSAKGSSKGVGLLSKGFKFLGASMKAAGIGLIVGAVVALGAAFLSNQKFLNAFNIVTQTLGNILSQVAGALVNVYESVAQSSSNFNALGKVLSGILELALTPFKLTFYQIQLAIQTAQLAFEDSIFGDKDPKTIKALNKSISDTKVNILEVGFAASKAGKDVVDNFGEAITEVGDISKKVVDEVGKISVKSAIDTAKTNVAIKNTAILAVAQQSLLLEKFDRLAETQRQIRDDNTLDIKDRQKANDQLLIELEKQEKAQVRLANIQIASAKARFDNTGLIEDEAALTDALANKEGVLAAITGFKSEQIVNRIALKKEEIDLDNSISDAEKERQIQQIEFEASQELREIDKLDKQRERLELENEIILEDIERKRELYLEGTQARIDAEQLYLTEKQRIDNETINNERETELESQKIKLKALEDLTSIAGAETKVGQALLIAKNVLLAKELIIEASKTLSFATQAGARSTIAVAEGVAQTAKVGFPQNIPLLIGYAAQAAGIISAISSATSSAKAGAVGGGGSIGSVGSAPQQAASAPSFNLVEGTDSNQISQSINQGNQTPTQAFVVGSAITTQQELDRNKISIGSI
jgi:hypothetical protein